MTLSGMLTGSLELRLQTTDGLQKSQFPERGSVIPIPMKRFRSGVSKYIAIEEKQMKSQPFLNSPGHLGLQEWIMPALLKT
jgi:hypothetical protein